MLPPGLVGEVKMGGAGEAGTLQEWRRRILVAAFNGDLSELSRVCKGHKNVCSASGRPHIPLWG